MSALCKALSKTGTSRRDWNYNQNLISSCRPLINNARLGNAILKELKEYDRSLSVQQIMGKKSSISGRPESAHAQKKVLRRGLRLMEYGLQRIYSKIRKEREAELMQEETAARGIQGAEV